MVTALLYDLSSHWYDCSAVPVHIWNGPIAWPPVLLLAAFSRTAHPNNLTLDTALPWGLSSTPAKCEVDWMNGCRLSVDMHTYTVHTYIQSIVGCP